MPVSVICPHLSCGKTVVAPDSARGKPVRCIHCGDQFIVPPLVREQIDGSAAPQPSDPGGKKSQVRNHSAKASG